MGRPEDIEAWNMVDRLNPRTWKCRYCQKSYTGSVTRVKHHLACSPGGGIDSCSKVPGDVRERGRHLLGAKAKAGTARQNESPIQMNGIRQMQTHHVIPTVAVSNDGVHTHQYREYTESYGTSEVQPVAVSASLREPNHQNETCAAATDPQ
ncbi:hypothetical protein RGQ29_002482 [Quercus rubra]|uniref:BED-type domain-containing protein n=1 Tax=Quercus rubra TaxID=3512 RepID=A0AAN7ICZ3_QUERU|nr:hypothetical protein RGQ29_002482 [Quercus rubra]